MLMQISISQPAAEGQSAVLKATGHEPTLVLVSTWRVGYRSGLEDAVQAKRQGSHPFLLKLVGQDSPNPREQRDIVAEGLVVLSVSNRFRDGWDDQELVQAFMRALRQAQEGFGGWAGSVGLRPAAERLAPSEAGEEMSDEDKKQFLRAFSGSADDDGVR